MSQVSISEENFHLFQEYFYRKTGIKFERTKRYFVDKRLIERIEATASDGFANYYKRLRADVEGLELQLLTNLMTVNETYFMREDYQFDCLVDSILPELTANRRLRKPIRVWCIPSSTGEEPYSIAMTLLERWPGLHDWDLEILASDIDTGVLRVASAGRYSARSVHNVPPEWLRRYFRRVGDEYQLCDDIRHSVSFSRVNLASAVDTAEFRDIDVIFCRNLLIYFDDVSRRAAAETFYESLAPGGYLCLGHSESMSRISSLFRVRKFPQALVYQKPLEAQ